MRVPGAAGHKQHRLMLQLANSTGDVERVGHHHQAGLVAELRNHRRRGGAAIDNDPRMFADARHTGASDGLLVLRDWRSEEHTSELQSQSNLVCRLLLEKK